MKNRTIAGKAFLASVLSLTLCFAMLLGTTFAWFTDKVSTGSNMIISGDLEISLKDGEGNSLENATNLFRDKNGNSENLLWEPNATFKTVDMFVKNEGNLALKYRLIVNITGENAAKLLEVVTVTVTMGGETVDIADFEGKLMPAETSQTIVITAHMDQNAGSEYENLEASLSLTVLATQLNAEFDSLGNDYDTNAGYELTVDASGSYLLYNAQDLVAFNKMMNAEGLNGEGSPKSAKLMGNVDMAGYDWLSINEMFYTFDGQGFTISNLNCVENGNKSGLFGYLGGGVIKNLTLKNVTSVGSQAGLFVGQAEGTNVLNCTVEGTNVIAWDNDSSDAITKNGIGIFVGVSVETNTTTGVIAQNATIAMVKGDMDSAASGVWATNNKYVGGLFTETQNVNVIDAGASLEGLVLVSDGLYKQTSATRPTFYVTTGEGLAAFAAWRNANVVTEGSPIAAYCTLLCDVDMAGVDYDAFDGQFTEFNGNGYTIKNLNAGQGKSGKGGLVSYLGGGIIKDLTLENARVTGSQVGLFAGQSEGGKIENCFVKGTNTVIWSQNTTSSYVETWGGIGAIVGYCSGGTINATICEGAKVVLVVGDMTSQGTKVDNLTGYGLANSGTVINKGVVVLSAISPELATTDAWDGTADISWFLENPNATEYILSTAEALSGLADLVEGSAVVPANAEVTIPGAMTFEGVTFYLGSDVDLASLPFDPIGHSANGQSFNGVFDGQGYTISNMYEQSDLNAWQYEGEYYGLFAYTNGATIKNVIIADAYVSSGRNEAAGVVGHAVDTTFSDITISNTTLIAYNNSAGGVAAECYGNCSFTNVTVDEDTVIGPLWGTYDVRLGGVVGMVKSSDKVTFSNITVACKLDAINDVAANYQYWLYRYSGMLIGQVDGVNGVADPTGYVTCENVTVIYGDWVNYHYCEDANLGAGSYNDPGEYKYARVEAGTGTGGIDLSACDHNEDESHNVLIVFDQLFGGGQGVAGLKSYDGVEVIYPNN